MKSVTEFPSFTLTKGIQTKTSLASEGKTPEEMQTSIGESFKYEGDKLKHFINAMDVAEKNPENLKRIVVMSLNEGENAPAKAVQVEEHYYVPEFLITSAPKPAGKPERGGRRGGGRGGDRDGGKKSSPWGMSPEETAAKKNKSTAAKPQ